MLQLLQLITQFVLLDHTPLLLLLQHRSHWRHLLLVFHHLLHVVKFLQQQSTTVLYITANSLSMADVNWVTFLILFFFVRARIELTRALKIKTANEHIESSN